MASYRNFLILVCLIAASLSGLPFSGKQVQLVVVSFTESAVIVHCVKLDVWVTHEKAGRIFYCIVVVYGTQTLNHSNQNYQNDSSTSTPRRP